jgi:hypothetical protein
VVFRRLGWLAGATAAAVVVLVSTNLTVAAMDEGGGPGSPTVLDAFTVSLNSGSVDRSQALLGDNAVIVDHDGQYAGARRRVWLARAVVDGIHVSVLGPCLLDGRAVRALDQATGSTAWRTMFSWRPIINGRAPLSRDGSNMLDTGAVPVYVDGIIVVDGGTIHFLGLGIAERSDCTALAPLRLAVNPPPAAAIPSSGVVTASCFSVALGLLLRRVRRRGRTTVHPTRNLLHHLHEATIQRRMAAVSAPGRGGSDSGGVADVHTSGSARR